MKNIPFISRLDTKVTLYRTTTEQDAAGEPKPTLEKVCETMAAVESETGDLVTDEKVHHVVKANFIIRKRNGLVGVPELVLEADGVKYKVVHVSKIRRSHLKIQCADHD
jgi:hypothetical protein